MSYIGYTSIVWWNGDFGLSHRRDERASAKLMTGFIYGGVYVQNEKSGRLR
jgi:hypothetical protein